MRVRPESYLFPVILVVLLFFYDTAFSEKKNSRYAEEGDGDKKIYHDNYKKRAAGSKRDITTEYRTDYNQDEIVYYIVKNGDTLFSIAKRSGLSLKKIQDLNNLDDDSKIFRGMKLRVLSGKNNKNNRKNEKDTGKCGAVSLESVSASDKPLFSWPLKKVNGYSRDGKDGVKSIGLIIKGNPGGDVVASENGVVKKVGYMRGYGKYIVLNHGRRYITVYSNLMEVDVKNGDTVRKGGRIGNISDDMTLHFQIDREGKPENPLSLLPSRS